MVMKEVVKQKNPLPYLNADSQDNKNAKLIEKISLAFRSSSYPSIVSGYLPTKLAFLFSTKALAPSLKSSVFTVSANFITS